MRESAPSGLVDPGGRPGGRILAEWLPRVVVIVALLPLGKLGWDATTGGLGVEPVEVLVRRTGWWALTCLVATLAITPLRQVSGWSRMITLRKPLGLIAFFYASSHFLIYVVIDQWLGIAFIIEDILERPFITAGFLAFLLLVPLAATSSRAAIRRLGGRTWRRLHRLIYPAALLAVLHYYWLVKADTTGPLLYAAAVVLLLAARIPFPARRPSGVRARRGALAAAPADPRSS